MYSASFQVAVFSACLRNRSSPHLCLLCVREIEVSKPSARRRTRHVKSRWLAWSRRASPTEAASQLPLVSTPLLLLFYHCIWCSFGEVSHKAERSGRERGRAQKKKRKRDKGVCTKGMRWPIKEVRRGGESAIPSPSPDSHPACPAALLPLEPSLLFVFFPLFVRILLRRKVETPASRPCPGFPRRRGPGCTPSC